MRFQGRTGARELRPLGGGRLVAAAVGALLLVPTVAVAGPASTGHSAVDGQASRHAPVEGPSSPGIAWQTDIGYSLAGRGHEEPYPIDDQGRLFVTGRIVSDGPLNGVGYLNAFDSATGDPVWESPFFGVDSGCHPVATDDGRVLVQLQANNVAHGGPDNPLVAIDASTGDRIVGQSYTDDSPRLKTCASRLVLTGDTVLISFRGAQSGIRAVDISSTPWSEAWYWEARTDDDNQVDNGHSDQVVVNEAGDTAYYLSVRDRDASPKVWQLNAIDVSTGMRRHRITVPGTFGANQTKRLIAVDGGAVVALQGCQGESVNNQTGCVVKYTDNGATLSMAWDVQPVDEEGERQTVSTLTDTGTGVVAGWTLGNGRIYGLSLADGSTVFRHKPSSFSNNGSQLISDADGTLVHGAFGGDYLAGLDDQGRDVFSIPNCATSTETMRFGEPATVGGIGPDGTLVTGNNVTMYTADGTKSGTSHVLLGLRDGEPLPLGDCPVTEERVSGGTRIETAVEVSKTSFPQPDSAETVIIAVASNYPDALAGGPLARVEDAPLLLTDRTALNAATRAEIVRLGASKAILLGGTAALAPEVQAALDGMGLVTERIAGGDRFDTARLISRRVPATTAYVTEGSNPNPSRGWPDAVAVSGLASFEERPILLVSRDRAPAATLEALAELQATEVVVVGGEVAVAASTAAALGDYVPGGNAEAKVTREAGASRYATSVKIAQRSVAAGASTQDVWFATGLAFPDALAAGPAVARSGGVLLLVHGQDAADGADVHSYLSSISGEVLRAWFVGGTAAISDAVAARLSSTLGID